MTEESLINLNTNLNVVSVSMTKDAEDSINRSATVRDNATNATTSTSQTLLDIARILQRDTSMLAGNSQRAAGATLLGIGANITGDIAHTGIGFIKEAVGLIESIHREMKKSSPLLESVEQLFNIAMQLFFMPLGNKLAEELLPAVLSMLDSVVSMWDAFGDMSLGEMVEYAVNEGIKYLTEFVRDIGTELSGQTGIVGSIGHALTSVANFMDRYLDDIVNIVTGLTSFIMENIPFIISAIGMFMTAHVTLQLAQMAIISSITPWSGLTGALTIATALAALAGTGISIGAGMMVAAPSGSSDILPSVGGGSLGSTTINNISITGLTNDELNSYVREITTSQISESRLRSGY